MGGVVTEAKVTVAGMFPGMGSEHEGMLDRLEGEAVLREVFGTIDRLSGRDILARFKKDPSGVLEAPLDALLCVFGVSVCYWELLKDKYEFKALAGHSGGFYAALYAAGSLGLDECVTIIMEAQKAIESISIDSISGDQRQWNMAALFGLKADECEGLCKNEGKGEVYVSNINSATQIVIAGRAGAVAAVSEAATARGALGVTPLNVGFPLHTLFMEGIGDMLRPIVRDLDVREPAIPVIDHTLGHTLDHTAGKVLDGDVLDAGGVGAVLCGQLEKQVLWRDVVMRLDGCGFLEIGPSDVLSKLVRWIKRDALVVDKPVFKLIK